MDKINSGRLVSSARMARTDLTNCSHDQKQGKQRRGPMRIEAIMEFDEGHLEQFYKLFADDPKVRIINARRVTEQEMQRWERELGTSSIHTERRGKIALLRRSPNGRRNRSCCGSASWSLYPPCGTCYFAPNICSEAPIAPATARAVPDGGGAVEEIRKAQSRGARRGPSHVALTLLHQEEAAAPQVDLDPGGQMGPSGRRIIGYCIVPRSGDGKLAPH
jgi:hypothetical protein